MTLSKSSHRLTKMALLSLGLNIIRLSCLKMSNYKANTSIVVFFDKQ